MVVQVQYQIFGCTRSFLYYLCTANTFCILPGKKITINIQAHLVKQCTGNRLVQHLYILCITIGLYTLLFWLYKSYTKYLYVPEVYCIAYVQPMYTQIIVYRLFRILYIATLYKLHLAVVMGRTDKKNRTHSHEKHSKTPCFQEKHS
jgi:hypothetical protein